MGARSLSPARSLSLSRRRSLISFSASPADLLPIVRPLIGRNFISITSYVDQADSFDPRRVPPLAVESQLCRIVAETFA